MGIAQGRPEFEQVFAQYRTALRRYILGMVRSDAEADDLLQETFVRVLRKLDTLENPAMLSPWLYRIATNVSRDRFRKTARDPVQVASDDSSDEVVDGDARLADLSATADVVLVLAQDAPDVHAELVGIPGVRTVRDVHTADGRAYRIQGSDGEDLRPAVYDRIREGGWPLVELRRDVRTLESVFNELATSESREAVVEEEEEAV